MDPEDPNRDKSLSAYDVRNNFLANFSYDLPFGPGKVIGSGLGRIPGAIVSGWQVNSIVSLTGGNPIDITLGINQAGNKATVTGTGFHERPDLVAGKSSNQSRGCD
jgi:trimeric autotransporter adhesin